MKKAMEVLEEVGQVFKRNRRDVHLIEATLTKEITETGAQGVISI